MHTTGWITVVLSAPEPGHRDCKYLCPCSPRDELFITAGHQTCIEQCDTSRKAHHDFSNLLLNSAHRQAVLAGEGRERKIRVCVLYLFTWDTM